jgi:hypothetical protein
MKTVAVIKILILLVIMSPELLQAQSFQISTGEKIRIKTTLSTKTITGEVINVRHTGLNVISGRNELFISQSEIIDIWVRRPDQRNIDRGFMFGILTGAVLFGVIESVTWEESCTNHWATCVSPSARSGSFSQGLIYGIIATGLLGAGIGYFIKTERWVKVRDHNLVFSTQFSAINQQSAPAITFRLSLAGS